VLRFVQPVELEKRVRELEQARDVIGLEMKRLFQKAELFLFVSFFLLEERLAIDPLIVVRSQSPGNPIGMCCLVQKQVCVVSHPHNGWVPRDFWLEDWEKQAIIGFHLKNPLEGSAG
jgi:hypothetical protein